MGRAAARARAVNWRMCWQQINMENLLNPLCYGLLYQSLREEIKDILEVRIEKCKEKYLGIAIRCGLINKRSFQIFKGSGLEQSPRLDGSMPAGWWEGGSHQIDCSSDILHVLLQIAPRTVPTYRWFVAQILGGGGQKMVSRRHVDVGWHDSTKGTRYGLGFRDIELFSRSMLVYSEKSLAVQSKHACIWIDKPPSIILEAPVNNVTLLVCENVWILLL